VKSHNSKTDENIVEKLKAEKCYKAHTMDCSHPVSYIVASFKGEQEEIIAKDVIK
jgi:hypothetical protein